MFSSTHVKENGDLMMLDEQGKRSVFCDVDEGDTEAPATAPVLIGIDPGAPEGDRTVYAEIPAAIETGHAPSAYAEDIAALAAEARASRFPSQPKMGAEWWARFFALADRMGDTA